MKEPINPWLRIVLCIAIFVGAVGFVADGMYTRQYGGVDLRNRVVGARVAAELKQDPYYFKWTSGQSDRYFDPSDNAAIDVSRVTVTPAVLALYSIFTDLPYIHIRWLWFAVQWASLLASVWLLAKLAGDKTTRTQIWILGLLGISGSAFWRLHVERGQMYIFYVFLFCLSLFLYKKYEDKIKINFWSPTLLASGLILGYLISLRPPYVFALIPMVLYKKFKLATWAIIGVLASVVISSFISPVPLWQNYYKAMQQESAMRLDETLNFRGYSQNSAEGVELKQFLGVPGEDSSLQTIFRGLFNRWFTSQALFVMLIIFMGALSAFLWKYKIPAIASAELFLLSAALSFFAEFFIAAQRWPYANVIWLIPLSLMILESRKIKPDAVFYIGSGVILLGIISSLGLHLIPRFTFAGEVGIPAAILLFLVNKFYLARREHGHLE